MKSQVKHNLFFMKNSIYIDFSENKLSNCPNSIKTIVNQTIKMDSYFEKSGQLDSWTVGCLKDSYVLGQLSKLNK